MNTLRELAQNANIRAFLRVVRAGESSQDDSAYTILYGGQHFEGFAEHPNRAITAGGYTSTAAGAYQFLYRTWKGLVDTYQFPDFSPECQDLGAIALLIRRDALKDVIDGDLVAALPKAGREWASLPGSPYGQPTISSVRCEEVFRQYGGRLIAGTQGPEPTVPRETKDKPMAPLLLALAPMIAELIPQVAKLFSSGSEVATRNVAAVEAVAKTITAATGSANVQEAIERMQADPALTVQVQQAVVTDPVIMGMLEVGGGIPAAREANQVAVDANKPIWANPAWVVFMMLLPLLYIVVSAVVFNLGKDWSDEMRSVVVTAIVTGLLGSITGFFFGSSYGSQKKTDAQIANL